MALSPILSAGRDVVGSNEKTVSGGMSTRPFCVLVSGTKSVGT